MNRYRRRDGHERLWIQPEEIEQIMEDRLAQAGLLPTVDAPAVEIDTFVECHLQAVFDQHARLPPTVLGETEFRAGAKPRVSINRDLTGAAIDDEESAPGLRGRWRATVAHEGAHVILHRCLYDLDPGQGLLFSADEAGVAGVQHLQRCLKRDVLFRGGGSDWREVQANMGMAALLMPKSVFIAVCAQEVSRFAARRVEVDSSEARTLELRLAERFEVSRQAVRIRLETLQLLAQQGQATLL